MNKLQHILEKQVDNKSVFGAVLKVERSSGEVLVEANAGNIELASQYFIASTTKLFTTALIMQLRAQGKLALTDSISNYLTSDQLAGLNTFNGTDHSAEVTIQNLLAQTSGIPDYFSGKTKGGISVEDRLMQNEDWAWDLDDCLGLAKQQSAKFVPGQTDKAEYSDTNFQILGHILESHYHLSYAEIVSQQICKPLGLNNTFVWTTESNPDSVIPMYYKSQQLFLPKAMASVKADGGVVSTVDDSMKFIKAFFQGQLFPESYLVEMCTDYHGVMFPLQYGTGLMRFKLPWYFTFFRNIPEVLGHSGISGAFDYYCPEKDIYLCGTLNQINNPSRSYRMIAEIVSSV